MELEAGREQLGLRVDGRQQRAWTARGPRGKARAWGRGRKSQHGMEALKASHARMAPVMCAPDVGGCPGLASAPTAHELSPGSATAISQNHLHCPHRASLAGRRAGERMRAALRAAGGRGEENVSQKPRPLAAARAPALARPAHLVRQSVLPTSQ